MVGAFRPARSEGSRHARSLPAPPPGFTLIELVVTVSVASILLALSVPAFAGLWLDSQRTVAVNAMVHSIHMARNMALIRGREVSICRSVDGSTCSIQTADWQRGWIVFVNRDQDDPPFRDEGEEVLLVQAPWSGGTITSNRRSFSFRPYYHRVVNGTLVFCDRRGPSEARAIIINGAGRPRLAKRDSSNRPLRCPSG